MKTRTGMFIFSDGNGSTVTDKVYRYDSYQEMINDTDPGKYGIVDNTVYHRTDNGWVVGFSNVVKDDDYTAFEVYAHDTEIPVDGLSMTIEEQTFTNAEVIPAGMIHSLSLRTMHPNVNTCDIVIDWGDGTIESVANGDFLENGYEGIGDLANGERNYSFEHTYAENGRYIVKIYGKDYYNVINGYVSDRIHGMPYLAKYIINNNLMCRCLSDDLPLATNNTNLTRFCAGAPNLFYVNVDRLKYRYYTQCQSFACSSINLVKAVGFKRQFTTAHMSCAFADCHNLVECDAQFPIRALYAGAGNQMFCRCYSLVKDINSFIPDGIYETNKKVHEQCISTFAGCANLTGTITEKTASVLWNTWNGTGASTNNCFAECNNELRAQIPTSWGGTMTE